MRKEICVAVLALVAGLLPTVAFAKQVADKFVESGLVDVLQYAPTLIVDLRYATTNNFAGVDMYDGQKTAYLTKEAARSLAKAQKYLKSIDPNYSIIVFDAARPLSTQRKMWNLVKNGAGRRYVARPGKGGPHNYGVAVDVGLAYCGHEMDMGTEFDNFTALAHTDKEKKLVATRQISAAAHYHRYLLRKAMTRGGFMIYKREWWHFERHRIAWARRNLRLLDF